MKSQDIVEQQYYEAVDALVEKVKKDPYILAAIVAGSFSYAQVWERSDLDVELIGRDDIRPTKSFFSLVENGVNIHACLSPRNSFKQAIESAQQGSFMHSYFSHSTLLFSRDVSIKEWYDKNASRDSIGERDKQLQLLNVIAEILPNPYLRRKAVLREWRCGNLFLVAPKCCARISADRGAAEQSNSGTRSYPTGT